MRKTKYSRLEEVRTSSDVSPNLTPHGPSGTHRHRRITSDTELGELEPLRDPELFADDYESDDAKSLRDENGNTSSPAPSRRPRYKRDRFSEKRLSRAFEHHNTRRPLTRVFQILSSKKANICLVCGLLLLGIAAVFILSGAAQLRPRVSEDDAGDDYSSPPWYPAPAGGTVDAWASSYTKASELVSRMSLLEKVNVTTGTGWMMGPCVGNTGPAIEVGFPGLCLQDGPLGIRFTDHITATPAGITVGATWNKKLFNKRGRLIGQEARAKGVNVQLGPAVGAFGRMPAGGRNWEGFGSDPVLQGIAAAATIQGIQHEGVIATIKHFVGNEQEHFRQPNEWGIPTALSSNIADRTLHEVYAWPFADAIRAGVGSVMCSYQQVNNSHACQNSKLMNGILKDELGFQGFVQSDWLAQRSGVASALAGLDMSMPGDGETWMNGISFWGMELTKAVMNGTVPMSRLDDAVTRIVAAWYQMGQDNVEEWGKGPNFSSWTNQSIGLLRPGSDDEARGEVNKFVDAAGHGDFSHAGLARRIAAEGTILLKNEHNMLPLGQNARSQDTVDSRSKEKVKVMIIGEDAVLGPGGPNACSDRACNEGTLASAWGSGAVEFPYLIEPADTLRKEFDPKLVEVKIVGTNDQQVVSKARLEQQQLCIVFANSDAGEGYARWQDINGDRPNLNLQKGGEELINTVAARCGKGTNGKAKVVVVIHAVGPVIMESFIEHPNVGAVLLAMLPGQESGNALADVIFGRVNPSGHLPFTIGKSLTDYGPGGQVLYQANGEVPQQDFREGVFVDYKWFDTKKITPRFAFGYGLSYSDFKLSNMKISPINPEVGMRPPPTAGPRPPAEAEPPKYNTHLPSAESLLFPSGWRKLKKYIYPYLENVEDAKPHGAYPFPKTVDRPPSAAGGGQGGHPGLWEYVAQIDIDVTNLGDRDASAVVQAYVIFPEGVEDTYGFGWPFTGKSAKLKRQDAAAAAPPPPPPKPEAVPAAEPVPPPDDAAPAADPPQPPPPDAPPGPPADGVVVPDPEHPPPPEATAEDDYHRKLRLGEEAQRLRAKIIADNGMTPFIEEAPSSSSSSSSSSELDPAHAGAEPLFQAALPLFPPKLATQAPPAEAWYSWASLGRWWTGEQEHFVEFPPRSLRGFEKVHLRGARSAARTEDGVGETQTVSIYLTRRDLSYWSVKQQNWVIPDGSFWVEVGFSSRDLRARGTLF